MNARLPPTLSGQRIAVWGYGVEGRATASYLARYHPGSQVTVFCPPQETGGTDAHQGRRWTFCTKAVTADKLNSFDLVIKSPGISPYRPPASDVTVPVIGSAALWFAYHRHGKIIAVTGTKGKSTTASLLAHVLNGLGETVNLAGNIGTPLLEYVDRPATWTVLETSSYQAAAGDIEADCAVLLNLFPEHLDWHGSEARYYQDKLRLLEAAPRIILGQPLAHFENRLSAAQCPLPPALKCAQSPRWQVRKTGLYHQSRCVFSCDDWILQGQHNLHNLAAVLQVIEVLGLSVDSALQTAREFLPLPHRLQPVGHIGAWHWINDSIASTPHASLAALSTVDAKTTTMILGGYDRQLDWEEFARAIQSNPPASLVVTGANARRILKALEKYPPACQVVPAADLAEAVKLATCYTPAGGTILLSPGAPSFDAFPDYAARGRYFEKLLREMDVKSLQGRLNSDSAPDNVAP